ncbi:SIS domain-containing protein [[Eubacterium] hominis]|uniref:SIS domain-containing protein n=1 Tax=[Eubacterium] hominis TaxID=2764325 RepID=UPI003A4E2664
MIFGKDKTEWESLKGIFTSTEINQQPSTWKKTIKQVEDSKDELKAFIENVTKHEDYDIILTGAGTSEFVGNALYSYLNKLTNYKTKSYGTTDIVATPENYLSQNKPTLLVSFGRSGNSPESVAAVDVADEVCGENVYHLFVTCNCEGALSKAAEKRDNAYAINLTPETHDQSFAMTSSFSNMMLATLLCFRLDTLEEAKKELEDVIVAAENALANKFEFFANVVKEYDFNRIVYLGANALKGIAQESQLKMLELTAGKVATMFDTPMGFRHGPKSIINDETLTVVYVSDNAYTREYETDLIKEMSAQRKGNKIVAVMNKMDEEIAGLVDYAFSFDLKEEHDNMFLGFDYIIAAQILALFKSLSYDITPDNPCPSGEVNRVVKGVIIHPYTKA